MFNKIFISLAVFLGICVCFKAGAQTTVFHQPSEYKTSWQRLLLHLSTAYYTAVRENQVDLDSSLVYCSRSLGLSRLPVIAEGIDVSGVPTGWIDKRSPGTGIKLLAGASGKKHLQLLVLLGGYYAFQPECFHRHKDSVLFYLDRAVNESRVQNELQLNRQAQLLIAKMYVSGYDFQHGDPLFDQLIKECERAGDKITEANVLFYRGLYTGFTPETAPKRIAYLQQAQQLYHQQNNTEGEINALTDIAYLNVPLYKLDFAYKASIEALRLTRSIEFPFIHYNTDAVAMITAFKGKFGEPLRYALETVKVSEAQRDSIGLAYFYSRLGFLYDSEYVGSKQAAVWQERSVNQLLRSGGDYGLYQQFDALVNNLVSNGQADKALKKLSSISQKIPPANAMELLCYNESYVKCYIGLKQFADARKYLVLADSAERQLEKQGNFFRKPGISSLTGNLYFLEKNYPRARIYLERFITDPAVMSNGFSSALTALSRLILIDSAVNDKTAQINHMRAYQKLSDSVFDISHARQAEELSVKYDIASKEEKIYLLNQKEKLQQANLNKATLVKNVTIGGILLVLAIAGLFYRQSRLRKKNNELISTKNLMLENLVTEKEWLLKEVHHRVKNNLHTVICLLESQAAYLENADALKALEISQNRIYAMSLIHQKLYQSDDVKTIDMGIYIPEFIQYLTQSFGSPAHIKVETEVGSLKLDISQAIPLSIIINEAVVNAFKYAFPGSRNGTIHVGLHKVDNTARLVVSDNGIGMQHAGDDMEIDSLGIELIKGLTRDLKGTLKFDNTAGTRVIVLFTVDLLDHVDMNGVNTKGIADQI